MCSHGYLITQCCKLLCSGKLILGYSTPKTRGHVDFRAGRDKMGQGVNTNGQGAALLQLANRYYGLAAQTGAMV